MTEITINLPDDIYNSLIGILGNDSIEPFSLTAIEELMGWLIADQRPTSISDLETTRIFNLYNTLFQDMLPTSEDIGKTFQLPMGRSRYIVQNLFYRHPEFMKKRKITTIISAIERNEVSEDGLPIIIVPKECDDYLVAISTELYLDRLISTTPRRIRLSESIRFEFGANDRDPLLHRFMEEVGRLR